MANRSKLDLSQIEFSSLTPDEWDVIKRRIIREAQRERARVINGALVTLLMWIRHAIVKAWRTVFVDEHPVFPSRCI
jgi:hypothetical protein